MELRRKGFEKEKEKKKEKKKERKKEKTVLISKDGLSPGWTVVFLLCYCFPLQWTECMTTLK